MIVPTVPVSDKILMAQSESRNTIAVPPQPQQDNTTPIFTGGGIVLGIGVLWTALAKFLERYGTSALDAREQKIKQELEQDRGIAEFYLQEANRDSKTINDTLSLFVTKHLDTTTQLFDMYYAFLEDYKKVSSRIDDCEQRLEMIEALLKDILAVLQMRDRQNK